MVQLTATDRARGATWGRAARALLGICLIFACGACEPSASQATPGVDASAGGVSDAHSSDAGDVGPHVGQDVGQDASQDISGADLRDDDTASAPDAHGTDGGDADLGDTDLGDTPDGSVPDNSLPTHCEGDCRQQTLAIDYAGKHGEVSHAAFGLTAPQRADSGQWEIYIEAWQGGFRGCPQQNSPTPDWMLILSGLQLPLDGATRTKATDGLSVVFFDFQEFFFEEESGMPFVRAAEVGVTPVAARVDVERVLAEGGDEDAVVALAVDAVFENGQIAGHLVATHCPSLDVLD